MNGMPNEYTERWRPHCVPAGFQGSRPLAFRVGCNRHYCVLFSATKCRFGKGKRGRICQSVSQSVSPVRMDQRKGCRGRKCVCEKKRWNREMCVWGKEKEKERKIDGSSEGESERERDPFTFYLTALITTRRKKCIPMYRPHPSINHRAAEMWSNQCINCEMKVASQFPLIFGIAVTILPKAYISHGSQSLPVSCSCTWKEHDHY